MYEANTLDFRMKKWKEKEREFDTCVLGRRCDERRRLWILRLFFFWWTSYSFSSLLRLRIWPFFPSSPQILRDHEDFVVVDDDSSLELRRWAWWWWFLVGISESFFFLFVNSTCFCEIDKRFCVSVMLLIRLGFGFDENWRILWCPNSVRVWRWWTCSSCSWVFLGFLWCLIREREREKCDICCWVVTEWMVLLTIDCDWIIYSWCVWLLDQYEHDMWHTFVTNFWGLIRTWHVAWTCDLDKKD